MDQTFVPGNYQNTFQIIALANEPPNMQNWNGCDSLEEHQIIELVDIRDDNVYRVSKLKDGNCWMIDNLRITGKTITPEDSNVSVDYVIPESNLAKFNIGLSNYDSKPNNEAAYEHPELAGHYTWNTATAGTGALYTIAGQNAPSSICPLGWRLPTGGTGGELSALNVVYGGAVNTNTDAHLIALPLPGFVRAGTAVADGTFVNTGGRYWSSTAKSATHANNLRHEAELTYGANSYYRANGYSVRCVAASLQQYSITYELNSGSGGPSPNPQTGETYALFVELSNSTPRRPGYEFKGWCDHPTTNETCSGKTYQPGEQYTLSSDVNSVTLWAMWEKNSSCPNAVTDCRVGSYPGKRFGNGKCWMSTDYKSDVAWHSSHCSGSGGDMPTGSDFDNLISSSQAGSGSCLYEQGWSGDYWSSTSSGYNSYFNLNVKRSSAYNDGNVYAGNVRYCNVRCVSS